MINVCFIVVRYIDDCFCVLVLGDVSCVDTVSSKLCCTECFYPFHTYCILDVIACIVVAH